MVLQPFEEFRPHYLSRILEMGNRYLVSQTYHRVPKNDSYHASKINLLFSDYRELGEARLHMNAVKKDRYAAVVDLKNPVHLKKITEMLNGGNVYRMFLAVVKSNKMLEHLVNRQYKDKLKRYIEKHTNWRITHDATVNPAIQVSFGELFIIIKHRNQQIRIKFEEIEH